jgi:hypothetical protein
MTKYFLSHSGIATQETNQALVSKLPRALPCSICPPEEFPSGKIGVSMRVSFLSPEQFEALGIGPVEAVDTPIV